MEQAEKDDKGKVDKQLTIKKYLLGTLNDPVEMERIEEQLMLSDNFAEELSLAEDFLIEEYLDEELTQTERSQFINHFLISPERRENLQLVKNIRKYARAPGIRTNIQPVGEKRGSFVWRDLFSSLAFRFAVIAVLLAGVAVTVWRVGFYQSDADKSIAALQTAFKGQRPLELRTSIDFGYAPFPVTRGVVKSAPTDVKAQNRAARLASDAVENSFSPQAQHALGLVYLVDKDFDKALEEFNGALKNAPNDVAINTDAGVAYLEKSEILKREEKLGKSTENAALSLKYLDKALEVSPNLPEALFNRALVLQKMGTPNEARKAWEKYLEVDSGSQWANEARERLKTLRDQNAPPKTSAQIYDDFLDAYRKKDDSRAWQVASQTKELITDAMILPQLSKKYLAATEKGRKDEAEEILSAFFYLGNLEKEKGGDLFPGELADYYSKTTPNQQQKLREAYGEIKNGYAAMLDNKWNNTIATFEKAKALFISAGDHWEAGIAEFQICYSLTQAGKYIESTERALVLSNSSEQKKHKWLQAFSEGWAASNYSVTGELSKAISHNQNALKTAFEISDSYGIQRMYISLAFDYRAIGDTEKTLETSSRSMDSAGTYYFSPRQLSRNFLQITQNFYRFNLYEAAEAYAREHVDLAENIVRDKWMAQTAHNNLAIIYAETGDLDKALEESQKAFQIAVSFDTDVMRSTQTARTQLTLANIQKLAGDCPNAIGNYNQVIEAYAKSDNKVYNYSARKERLLCYIALGNDNLIKEEMAGLINIFDESRLKINEEADRNTFFNNEQSVYDIAADYTYTKLKDSEQAFNYEENSRARSLLSLIKGQESRQPLVLSELQRKIPSNAQVLYYAVLQDKLLIWHISQKGVSTFESRISANDLNDKIQRYTGLLKSRNESERELGKELYAHLIAPVAASLEADKTICVVPDKSLFRVPFAALVSPETNKYLIQDYALLLSPSATIFLDETNAAQQKSQVAQESILSIGNPAFIRADYPDLEDLPQAVNEANQVAGFYGDAKKTFVNKDAIKEAISGNLNQADVVHFAGHYVPNAKEPAKSRLLLSGGDLTVEEISQQDMSRVRLMVLAACETGIERFYNGEGMIGASRAFLAAGVPLVVASQWPVDTVASADLMVEFHHQRKTQNSSTIAALRQAQLKMITEDNSLFRQPYYWAAFTPIGGAATY